MKKSFIGLLIFILAGGAFAERAMTRDEALALLSKSSPVKKKESAMFNWGVGYDISKINRVRLTPIINYIKAVPKKIPPDNRTIIEVSASVDDPGGLKNISGVKADLSSLGKLAGMTLVDNGLWGDAVPGDGVYTLQTTVKQDIPLGDKEVPVTAANKNGWLAVSKTSIDIEKDPIIVSASASPDKVAPSGGCLLSVQVENPGRIDDVSEVKIDLKEIGGGEIDLMMENDSVFSQNIVIPERAGSGAKKLPVKITNLAGGQTSGIIQLEVQ